MKNRTGDKNIVEEQMSVERTKKDDDEQENPACERRLKPKKIGKYHTVRAFLGNVIEQNVKQDMVIDNDEDKTNAFLVCGKEPPIQKNEPIADMLMLKKEIGEDIRRSLKKLQTEKRRRRRQKKDTSVTLKLSQDQRLFLRTHGTMGLVCLRAVHQAYEDRNEAQRQAALYEKVSKMKESRELAIAKVTVSRTVGRSIIVRERYIVFIPFLHGIISRNKILDLKSVILL